MPSSIAMLGTSIFISTGTAGTSSSSASANSAIIPTMRSIRMVNAPSIFAPGLVRLESTPILTTSPPIAPPGITSEKKYPCMVSDSASNPESRTPRIRVSRCQRHAQTSMCNR